ncbi:hypothetical protein D3C77_472280 [compost metagenome]
MSSTVEEDGLGYAPGEWVYDLMFHDGRYLPCEGTGAISQWRLEIPDDDFATVLQTGLTDIRVNLVYTACDGGDAFRKTINEKRKPPTTN